MTRGFFVNLPTENKIDILSRLSARDVIIVVRSGVESNSYEIFEFQDSLDLEHHDLRNSLVTKVVSPRAEALQGSANGLVFMTGDTPCDLYVCNPVTRDFIKLCPYPDSLDSSSNIVIFGFGVTKTTGQHKVVAAVCDYELAENPFRFTVTRSHCENQNPHHEYLALILKQSISARSLSHPPLLTKGGSVGILSVLEGRLCLCDNSSEGKIIIWVMREYGVAKSWIKEYVINKDAKLCGDDGLVSPIKVFKNGDILMKCDESLLFYYNGKTQSSRKIEMFDARGGDQSRVDAILLHTSSFLSLRSFGMEDLYSF
ncbi:uncharacterized protein LOC121780105 [Salvia splendens]|uniref:uncharacterized protein LOC121780105 n=1 Tax=Salvia splendens TaxID=180675 RepID=UPI001C27E153|nr:uncharacterized protein LOC121780105 [Salvia splendens]